MKQRRLGPKRFLFQRFCRARGSVDPTSCSCPFFGMSLTTDSPRSRRSCVSFREVTNKPAGSPRAAPWLVNHHKTNPQVLVLKRGGQNQKISSCALVKEHEEHPSFPRCWKDRNKHGRFFVPCVPVNYSLTTKLKNEKLFHTMKRPWVFVLICWPLLRLAHFAIGVARGTKSKGKSEVFWDLNIVVCHSPDGLFFLIWDGLLYCFSWDVAVSYAKVAGLLLVLSRFPVHFLRCRSWFFLSLRPGGRSRSGAGRPCQADESVPAWLVRWPGENRFIWWRILFVFQFGVVLGFKRDGRFWVFIFSLTGWVHVGSFLWLITRSFRKDRHFERRVRLKTRRRRPWSLCEAITGKNREKETRISWWDGRIPEICGSFPPHRCLTTLEALAIAFDSTTRCVRDT